MAHDQKQLEACQEVEEYQPLVVLVVHQILEEEVVVAFPYLVILEVLVDVGRFS